MLNVALLQSYADQGMARQQMAAVLGVPLSTVSNSCTKHGIKTRRPERPLCENSQNILALRNDGLGYKEIAKRIGVRKETVVQVCKKAGLAGVVADPHPNKLTEEQTAEYVSRSGFDYVSGYINAKSEITVRCRECCRTFERLFHVFRDVANGTWNAENECPLCRNDRHLHYLKSKEQERKARAECEAQKRAELKAERLSRAVNEELTKRLAIHVCKNCGKEFCQMVTGYNSSSYCSQKCQTRWYNRTAVYKRRKKLMERKHDKDISLERLYKRDSGICYLCGIKCNWDDIEERDGTIIAGQQYPSIDHVIPVAKGGTHTWDNIKLACRRCNTLKRDRV